VSELANPHDRFFKEVLSRQDAAEDFVRHYLPAEVVSLLDPSSLAMVKDSFVDQTLQAHYSDILYTVTLNNQQTAYIYLLVNIQDMGEQSFTVLLLDEFEKAFFNS
jgi:predicted transposase/invertase (TIGR01784 family)